MKRLALAVCAGALALGGCAAGPAPSSAPRPSAPALPQARPPAGTGELIGARADALTRRFGAPRIDLAEGDVRKLQFAGGTCVLNIYLYPPAAGADPAAAHVDARLRQGGGAIAPADCIRQIEAR